ncbi:MAG: T9SS C-terminal target domain-containing protein [Vicinamibacterales bacterium]
MKRNMWRSAVVALVALVAGVWQGADVQGQVSVPGLDRPVVVHSGRITGNESWAANTYHVLRGVVIVEAGATLTVQAGTTVVGELATIGTLLVLKGGRLNAVGTPTAPIVFTSDQPIGQRARGDWGGVIINGNAPVNLPGGVGIGEGDTGVYGGSDPDDNSGILRYMRVEYAGIEFSPDNELNGIAFQAVGRGTTVDHIQVKHNKDDCVEFFGGTVDVKYLIVSSCGDDSIDWTFGWTGRVQFAVVHQSGDDADNGIEADNNANNNDLLPRSAPTIYNITLVGDPDTLEGNESDDGMEIREGTAGIIRNFIVTGFKENGIDYSNNATLAQAAAGTLSLTNGIVFGNGLLTGTANFDSNSRPILTAVPSIVVANPGLIDPFNIDAPNYRPSGVATLAGGQLAPALPPNDGFFEPVTFIGGLSPNPALDWTREGWTNFDRR